MKSLYACGEAVFLSLEDIAKVYRKLIYLKQHNKLDEETAHALSEELAQRYAQLSYCLDAAYELAEICKKKLKGKETAEINIYELSVECISSQQNMIAGG